MRLTHKHFWARRVNVTDLRAALRAYGDDHAARAALESLRGRRGRVNYVEAAWHEPAHIQRAIQQAASDLLCAHEE